MYKKTTSNICRFLGSVFCDIATAVFVGLPWVAFLLINGDWYVCFKNDRSKQQAQLSLQSQGLTRSPSVRNE